MMKYWQFLEWAANSASEADELLAEIESIVPVPQGYQPMLPTVESSFPVQMRIASIWDRFPADHLMAIPAEAEEKRLLAAETRLKALGDGKLLERVKKLWPILMAAWELYSKFNPV